MSFLKTYSTLEEIYGTAALANAMAVTAGELDDDDVTPADRLERTTAELKRQAHPLQSFLDDVNAALHAPGEHADILLRLKARLEAAL